MLDRRIKEARSTDADSLRRALEALADSSSRPAARASSTRTPPPCRPWSEWWRERARTARLRAFTYERHLLGHRAKTPIEALKAVVGAYSSHPSAPLTLAVRTRDLTGAKFRKLNAVRLPAMRGSIHLLPAATAHLAFGAARETSAQRAKRLAYFKLTAQQIDGAAPKLAKHAHQPITIDDARAILGEGIDAKGVVAQLCRDGAMARVAAEGLRSNALKYRAVEIEKADPDIALAWMAGEYLRAYGPIRQKDFQWWAGITATKAKAALAEHDTTDVGEGYLLHAKDEAAFTKAKAPKDSIDLLPKWDMLTMGYPKDGRDRLAVPTRAERCYDFRGDGLPVVLVDGEAAGTWSPRSTRRRRTSSSTPRSRRRSCARRSSSSSRAWRSS